MQSNERLLKNEYEDTDLDSIDGDESTERSARRVGRWIPRPLRPFLFLQALLILGYTLSCLFLVKKGLRQGCTERDLIYCEYSHQKSPDHLHK